MARSGTSDNIRLHSFSLEICAKNELGYEIKITKKDSNQISFVIFDPLRKILLFKEENSLTNFLRLHEYQFRKILHNKRLETFYIGFKLHFVIWENKNMLDFNNNKKIITFDNTEKEIKCYVTDRIVPDKFIYADGAFSEKTEKASCAIIIKDKENSKNAKLYGEIINNAKDSNQVELLAAIKGLELASKYKVLRLHTDSRYVKKGITEWIFYWQVNDWTTANGTKAKHIELWKKFLNLTSGKIVQFAWIKGHSKKNPENKLCDYYAKLLLNTDDN